METKNILIGLPVVLALLLIVAYSVVQKTAQTSSGSSETSFFSKKSDDSCGECSAALLSDDCRSTSGPVLGGVDLVNYFVAYKNSDGTYDETQTGVAGSSTYSSTYNGYLFYFSTQENKNTFDANPGSYVPKWGGFCSWGVSGEYCPKYTWSADCLGPSGSWSAWTIVDERIYFFKGTTPRDTFKKDIADNVAAGDERWDGWFGEDSDAQFNTNCYTK